MLTLLLIGILTLPSRTTPPRPSGIIYIRADGSIDPSEALIQQNGDIYTFTNNINDSIIVEKDNVVIDGNNRLLQHLVSGSDIGVGCDYTRKNVTIKNMLIDKFRFGIYFDSSSDIVVTNVTVTNCDMGIWLPYNSNANVTSNIVRNNKVGIELALSGVIARNNVTENGNGLSIMGGYVNVIQNKITHNSVGIFDIWGGGQWIENNLTNNGLAIEARYTGSSVYHNNFVGNTMLLGWSPSTNFPEIKWDDGYPSGGNYWDGYTGGDLNHGPGQDELGGDGIGDTAYDIATSNRDNYPYMAPNGWQPPPVAVKSNVTVTSTNMDRYSLNFAASGPTGEIGYINATVPVGYNVTEIRVFLDDAEIVPPPFPIITSNSTHYFVYFEFPLSSHTIAIQLYEIADVAATNATSTKTVVGKGYSIIVKATIHNLGHYEETFQVTVYANTTPIATPTITLESGQTRTFVIFCDTEDLDYGSYTIWVYAGPLSGEQYTANNNYTITQSVFLTIPGDVTGDLAVKLDDITTILDAFGSTIRLDGWYWHTPPCIFCPHSPSIDIDGDGKIALSDITTALDHFGEEYP